MTVICLIVLSIVTGTSCFTSQLIGRVQTPYTVFVAVLLPEDRTYLSSIENVRPGIELAVKRVKELDLLPGWKFSLKYLDTKCDSATGPWEALKAFFESPLNLMLGPVCDYPVAIIARFLKFLNVPLLTAGAHAREFSRENRTHEKAEYYMLVSMGYSFKGMANAINEIRKKFNWNHYVILYQPNGRKEVMKDHYCMLAFQALHEVSWGPKGNYMIRKHKLSENPEMDELKSFLNHEKDESGYRIIVMCASPDTIRDILLAAEELGMISSGDYVFFSIELFTSKMVIRKPWHRDKDSLEKNSRARRAYEALLIISARIPDSDEYKNFSRAVRNYAKNELQTEYEDEEVNTFVTAFHEAVILYSLALNETLSDGYSISNGSIIVQKMWNRTFDGITGKVTIDENGDRDADYSIYDLNPETGEFEVVANYFGTEKKVVDDPNKKIHWAGGRTSPPTDVPKCGFDGSKCKGFEDYVTPVVFSIVVVFLLIGSAALYRYYRKEAELASMSWKIKWEEVVVASSDKKKRPGSRMSLSRISVTTTASAETLPLCDFNRLTFIRTGFYKGTVVVLKPIRKNKIEINRPLLLEIKMMKDLQHDHIVRFVGAIIDYPQCYIVTEYSQRGSLQDILENEQIKLDWMFRYSLMHDLVKGMTYLHNTDVHSHGNLKSSNCVVDSRFALKITDFGLHSLRQNPDNDEALDNYIFWKRKLWTAPELLRMPSPPAGGTQKGDVYSFALIAHEIAVRQGTFYLGPNVQLSPKEIVDNVKNGQKSPFRPILDKETCDEEVIHMIRKCWTEDPSERPDFQALKLIIRRLNKDNDSGNILDNLLSRMEQYANNLEALVEERTADYLEEKRKAEDLLYQLLPRSVASQLIRGESVTAEAFDGVTIYFSDIVGFTTLSAESTPMEVVDFLNDLYTCFDSVIENFDVYKVETIGDAYMVVSGLPVRNGSLHVREIARMSLALLNTVRSFTIRHRPKEQLKLRIGLHTGPCAAGVVGLKMPRYCLFGDTVNTASRMESTGVPLKIHLSSRTKEVLDTFKTFIIELRGDIEIKGKGKMTTYWLMGEHQEANKQNYATSVNNSEKT